MSIAEYAPCGMDTLLTTAEAAQHAGVTEHAIRKWVQRGHLTASGLNEKGHPLYKLIDVAKAEHKTRNRRR